MDHPYRSLWGGDDQPPIPAANAATFAAAPSAVSLEPDGDIENMIARQRRLVDRMIETFVARFSSGPPQRSPQWLENRKTAIGSSEIAALFGDNPYMSADDLLAQKAGLVTSNGNMAACWWGTLFESAAEKAIAYQLDTILQGTDINVPAPIPGHRNSPDGYCSVVVRREGDAWRIVQRGERVVAGEYQVQTALVEIKVPRGRIPTGRVPHHYIWQVRSGLAVAPITDFGLFVDVVLRKCAYEHLGPKPGYDRIYHPDRRAERRFQRPALWGLTGVFSGDPEVIGELRHTWNSHELIDFGEDFPQRAFDRLLELINTHRVWTVHLGPWGRSDEEPADPIQALWRHARPKEILVGIIPWKIFEMHLVPVERDAGFLRRAAGPINQLLEAAAMIRSAEDPHAAYAQYMDSKKPADVEQPDIDVSPSPPGAYSELFTLDDLAG